MLAGTAAVIMLVAAVYSGHLLASPPPSAAGEKMVMQDNSKFASLSAYDSNHDYPGKFKDNMTFKSGEPVFLQADFTNLGDPAGSYYHHYYTVVIEVRNSDTSETAALSSVQTKFAAAGAGNSLAVETYWKPDQKANYTIVVFLQKSGDLSKTPVSPPVASVRVQVA